jgi:hypothetical protein
MLSHSGLHESAINSARMRGSVRAGETPAFPVAKVAEDTIRRSSQK